MSDHDSYDFSPLILVAVITLVVMIAYSVSESRRDEAFDKAVLENIANRREVVFTLSDAKLELNQKVAEMAKVGYLLKTIVEPVEDRPYVVIFAPK